MKRPWYLIAWMFAAATLIFALNFFTITTLLEAVRNKTVVFPEPWWLLAVIVFINAVTFVVLAIPIYRESVKCGFGRLVAPSDLRLGKRFLITHSVYDGDRGYTYVMFYCNLHSRICKIEGKKPDGATHLLIAGDSINQRFEYIEVSPEMVTILR